MRLSRRAPEPEPINTALRSHVTRVTFNLTLKATHIEALAYLVDLGGVGVNSGGNPRTSRKSAFEVGAGYGSFFLHAINGLTARGLVVHDGKDHHITTAGEHVIALLKESGMWKEIRRAEISAA